MTPPRTTRAPLSKIHEAIAVVLRAERRRPRPGWPEGYTVAAVTRRRAAGASSIDRLEAGTQARVNPAMTTAIMFNVYDSPPGLIRRVTELAEATMDGSLWEAYRPSADAAAWLWEHTMADAAHVTVHDTVLIPEAAQASAYAAALGPLRADRLPAGIDPGLPDAARLAARAASRARLTCLIGEAALWTDIGAAAAAAQRDHLVALDGLDNTDVYVVPFRAGPYPLAGTVYGKIETVSGTAPLTMVTGSATVYLDPDAAAAKSLVRGLHDSLARSVTATEYYHGTAGATAFDGALRAMTDPR